MKDNRSFKNKYFKRHTNWNDMTSKGKMINFAGRIVMLVPSVYILMLSLSHGWLVYMISLAIYFVIISLLIVKLDNYTCTRYTFAAEHEEIMRKSNIKSLLK